MSEDASERPPFAWPQGRTTTRLTGRVSSLSLSDVEDPPVLAEVATVLPSKTLANCHCCGQKLLSHPELEVTTTHEHNGTPSHKSIDSFAPKFKDLFHKGLAYVDQAHYMDGAMRGDEVEDTLPTDAAIVATIQKAHSLAAADMSARERGNAAC